MDHASYAILEDENFGNLTLSYPPATYGEIELQRTLYLVETKREHTMPLTAGQQVWIRCKVQPGPFSEERLVTIASRDGAVSGFVNSDELKTGADGESSVRGIVRSVEKEFVAVWIKGSFFTTNGLTNVSRELAMAA